MIPAPTKEYRVQLDAYSGPLDLLLHLVKRHEIALDDLPISELTEQYLKHIELIQAIDVEQAGEFLVMAATLLEIKSQMLAPQMLEAADAEGGSAETPVIDPRFELVQQLLAYKQYKDAAIELEERKSQWATRFPASGKVDQPELEDQAAPIEIDLDEVHALDLCETFSRILDSIGQVRDHQITYDDTPISLHADDIYDRLKRDAANQGQTLSFEQIFEGRTNRSELIGLFLAMLELVRQRKIRLFQERVGGQIRLELHPAHEEPAAAETQSPDWRDPKTGQIQYEWPDEQARQEVERRAKRMAQRQFDKIPPDENAFDPDQINPHLSNPGAGEKP